jgi:hypothetical protein
MADRIIVVGAKRARQIVPASEIAQMCGRGGRKHGGKACRATVIVESELEDEIMEGMADGGNFKVSSSLGDSSMVAFHILPEISHQTVTDEKTAESWYRRSFGAAQGITPDFKEVFDLLRDVQAVTLRDGKFEVTDVGRIAARLYFHPADVWAWKDNFDTIFKYQIEDNDIAVAWAMGTVPCTRISGDFGDKYWPVVEETKNEIPPILEKSKGTIVTITLWRYILGGPSVGKMRNQALCLRDNGSRICQALIDLDSAMEWRKQTFLKELAWRLKGGIPSYLAPLCCLPGITKGRARFLYDQGFTCRGEIAERYHNLEGDVDELFLKALRNIAHGFC